MVSTSGINGLLVVGVFLFFAHQWLVNIAARVVNDYGCSTSLRDNYTASRWSGRPIAHHCVCNNHRYLSMIHSCKCQTNAIAINTSNIKHNKFFHSAQTCGSTLYNYDDSWLRYYTSAFARNTATPHVYTNTPVTSSATCARLLFLHMRPSQKQLQQNPLLAPPVLWKKQNIQYNMNLHATKHDDILIPLLRHIHRAARAAHVSHDGSVLPFVRLPLLLMRTPWRSTSHPFSKWLCVFLCGFGVAQSNFIATASQNQIAANSSSRWSGRSPNSSSRRSGLLLVLVAIRCVFLALRCVASPSLSRWIGRADQILLGCLDLLALRCVLLAHRCMASRGVPCPDLAPLLVRASLQECDEGGWLLFGIVFVPLRSTIVFCFPPTTSCHSTGPMLVPRAWSRTPSVCPNRSGPLLPGRRSCPFVCESAPSWSV